MHTRLTPRDHYCINVFFAALQNLQCNAFLEKRRLRINSDTPVMAERAAKIAAWRKQH
jgi:hypothetical protein